MQVNYIMCGIPHALEIDDRDDLKEILLLTDEALRGCHPNAKKNPDLLVIIADGVLDSLAGDLGELAIVLTACKGASSIVELASFRQRRNPCTAK
jgi:hypothetical protein